MNLSEELIKEIVAKVCENMKNEDAMPFERNVLSNGMMSIKTETVKCEPFPFDIGAANKDVSLLDVCEVMVFSCHFNLVEQISDLDVVSTVVFK